MRVMGIDSELTRCGLGVVDVDAPRRARLMHVDAAHSDKNLATHFRLRMIMDMVDEVIRIYKPEIVTIGRVLAQENLQFMVTAMQAMGVVTAYIDRAGLSMAMHMPSEVKSAVSNNGKAGKAQVQAMV